MDPETGHIKLRWELFAGGMAGGCQVVWLLFCSSLRHKLTMRFQVFTNPLEIVYVSIWDQTML